MAIVAAILLLTLNVAQAVEVYQGHDVELRGSGLTAAGLAAMLLLAASAVSRYAVASSSE